MRAAHIFAALILTLAACAQPDSPEQQIRRVIDQLESAAEARDVSDLVAHLSQVYRDAQSRGPDEAARYARGLFLLNQRIHLVTKIEELRFPDEREARAKVLVGMAGREAPDEDAWRFAANLYEFELAFVREDDDWKVTYADWRRR